MNEPKDVVKTTAVLLMMVARYGLPWHTVQEGETEEQALARIEKGYQEVEDVLSVEEMEAAYHLAGDTVCSIAEFYGIRACRGCGCTDDNACEGGCSWVEDDLCSACEAEVREREINEEEG